MSFDNGIWQFEEQMGIGKGFVYVIRDKFMNRHYIGKKLFHDQRGRPSDWRRYRSSSSILKEMFKIRPFTDFEFICLEQYKTLGAVSYAETWSLCRVQAPTTPEIYNTRIEAVAWKVTEAITARHLARLELIVKEARLT